MAHQFQLTADSSLRRDTPEVLLIRNDMQIQLFNLVLPYPGALGSVRLLLFAAQRIPTVRAARIYGIPVCFLLALNDFIHKSLPNADSLGKMQACELFRCVEGSFIHITHPRMIFPISYTGSVIQHHPRDI